MNPTIRGVRVVEDAVVIQVKGDDYDTRCNAARQLCAELEARLAAIDAQPAGWKVKRAVLCDGICIESPDSSTLIESSDNLYAYFETLIAKPASNPDTTGKGQS